MRQLLGILFITVAMTSIAGTMDCPEIDGTSFESMTTEDQVRLFCQYRTNFLFKDHFLNERKAVYRGRENLMTAKTAQELGDEQRIVAFCKEGMDRVQRLLRERQVVTDALECKCPDGYKASRPYMRCSL